MGTTSSRFKETYEKMKVKFYFFLVKLLKDLSDSVQPKNIPVRQLGVGEGACSSPASSFYVLVLTWNLRVFKKNFLGILMLFPEVIASLSPIL